MEGRGEVRPPTPKKMRTVSPGRARRVDGTQIAAWASMKSFRAKDGSDDAPGSGRNGERDFHGEKRSNATHASTTDPEAQLYARAAARRPSSASWATC
jgi:hypothetical protein